MNEPRASRPAPDERPSAPPEPITPYDELWLPGWPRGPGRRDDEPVTSRPPGSRPEVD